MKKTWQLQEAKNKFSEVVNSAIEDGPQMVSRHGETVAVVISLEEFHKLKSKDTKKTLLEFFKSSPLVGSGLDLTRDSDAGISRKVDL